MRPGRASEGRCVSRASLAGRQGDEQAAVVVVRREDVRRDRLHLTGARAQLEFLTELSDAPFERHGDRALAVLETSEAEGLDDVLAHQVGIPVAGQLEDTAARREDATVLVAGNKPGVRGRVVVVQQLKE